MDRSVLCSSIGSLTAWLPFADYVGFSLPVPVGAEGRWAQLLFALWVLHQAVCKEAGILYLKYLREMIFSIVYYLQGGKKKETTKEAPQVSPLI